MIDDQSTDGTLDSLQAHLGPDVRLIQGRATPAGWAGKLWAQSQGLEQIKTRYVLLLDADISLADGLVGALREKAARDDCQLVSCLARLPVESVWERLLVPAYVYFFKLLYPFALVNAKGHRLAGAAGGCILVERQLIERIGGLESIKDALIDDCTLAARIKGAGHRIWLGLSHSVHSSRRYTRLGDFWRMVSRSAYTQLRYSKFRLLACSLMMLLLFLVPVLVLVSAPPLAGGLALLTLAALFGSYLPTLRFYDLSPVWALALPMVACLFLAMTWDSAIRYWRGTRATWKGRSYPVTNLVALVAVLLWAMPGGAETLPVPDGARETVAAFHRGLVEQGDAGLASVAARFARLEPLVKQTHDLAFVAQFTLRRQWPELSELQRARFIEAFSRLSVMTYANRFRALGPEGLKVDSLVSMRRGRAHVEAAIVRPDGGEIPLSYVLHHTDDAGWRIINIIANGVSDLALKRSEYQRVFERGAFDELMATIVAQTEQLSGD